MKKVLGIGNALVDILIKTDSDDELNKLGMRKGSMTLVDEGMSDKILSIYKSSDYVRSSGGSVANTMKGLGKLGISCGYIGKTGDDEFRTFFKDAMEADNIRTELLYGDKKTGKCTVIISPDNERTMATYLGSACDLRAEELKEEFFDGYDFFQLEGYLVQDKQLVRRAVELAKKKGLSVSIDLASFNIVEDNLEFYRELVKESVDIVFANEDEARAFTGCSDLKDAADFISNLADLVIVKCGAEGSIIRNGSELIEVSAVKAVPVDTTGAGDFYAAGFFYGLCKGMSLKDCAVAGSVIGANVVEIIGASPDEAKWNKIISELKSTLEA